MLATLVFGLREGLEASLVVGIIAALQTKPGGVDRLNEYIQHIGSGIFFSPRAPRQGRGQELFA